MHLANTFIQSNLHCIKFSTFLSINAFPENRIRGLGVANAMLYCLLFCMLTTYAPLVFTVPPTPPLSLPRPLTLSFVSRLSGSLCPGPCGGLNVFSLHTWVSPSCPSLPHSLSLSSLAVRVHQEGVDLRETYRKKKQWRLLFSDWDNRRFSCPLCLCLSAGAMPATSQQQVGSRGRCTALLLPLLLLSVAPRPGNATINIPSKCEYRILHCIQYACAWWVCFLNLQWLLQYYNVCYSILLWLKS